MAGDLAEAEARASRNGLRLEIDDVDAGPAWPGMRFASARLMQGRDQVASAAHSYRGEASKKRALSFCLKRVYNRPDAVD